MKQTTFQHPELRDANDNIIQQGTYGKESPLVNGDNTGVLDYINNNLEALHDNINGSRIYVANKAALPATGDLSAMYIAEDTGKWYLWDGQKYIETDNARKIADEALAARDAAKASQSAAKTSETNAKTSETNAASSKSAAATSASAAKTSENNAKTSETNAAASKTAAATSASAAATSETNAKTSENNAASSKTAAATSATNAANSATAAANSATAAANSAREQQADWAVTDSTSKAFIKNKPDVRTKAIYPRGVSGNENYIFYGTLTIPQDGSFFKLEVLGGSNYNSAIHQSREGTLYFRTGNGKPANYAAYSEYHRNGASDFEFFVVKDSGTQYRIYSGRTIYTGAMQVIPYVGQNSSFELALTTVSALPDGAVEVEQQQLIYANTVNNYALPKGGTAVKATADAAGNNIQTTYAKKSDLASSVTTNTLTATDATFTGATSVPTANAGNSSKAIANTEFVAKSISALVNGLSTRPAKHNELAKALGNDSNFAATVTAELAKKLNSTEAESTYATKQEAGVPYQIKRNTAYKVGDVLTSPSLPPGCVIVVTQAGTTGSTEPDWTTIKSNMGGVISDGTVTFYINDTLSKHSMGDIVYKPTTKTTEHEYLLPLDGQTIDGTKYKRLVDYLGSATLPNLNGRYLRADSTPGQMVDAGLPNITGRVGTGETYQFEGAFYNGGSMAGNTGTGGSTDGTALFDASRSNAIYGKSTTVTPLTYTVRAFICYA